MHLLIFVHKLYHLQNIFKSDPAADKGNIVRNELLILVLGK